MKSWLAVGVSFLSVRSFWSFLSFSSLLSFAAGSVNAGGLLRIDSRATNTVVNVPWVGFDADGAWEPVTTVAKGPGAQALAAAGAAGERTLARGMGLWLVRCGEGADVAKPFYVSGQLAVGAATTTIAKGTSSAPAWTLLANPDRAVATDLNAIDWQSKPLAADQITVATADGQASYTWKNGKWGTGGGYGTDPATGLMKQLPRVETAVAPAGAAVWYVRKGAAFSIQW